MPTISFRLLLINFFLLSFKQKYKYLYAVIVLNKNRLVLVSYVGKIPAKWYSVQRLVQGCCLSMIFHEQTVHFSHSITDNVNICIAFLALTGAQFVFQHKHRIFD